MTTHRGIQIKKMPAPMKGFYYLIGRCRAGTDTIEDAHEMIDLVLDTECYTYRKVFCWPDADNLLNFTVNGQDFAISMNVTDRPALERAIRAIIDDVLDGRS
jgi:hypothetical protein